MKIQAENGYPASGVQYVPEQRTGQTGTSNGVTPDEGRRSDTAAAGKDGTFNGAAAECELSQGALLAAENNFSRRTFTGGTDIFSRMKSSAAQKRTNLGKSEKYDATGDLMAVANAENQAALKVIQIRLVYKVRSLGMGGENESDEAKASKRKIKRVISRIKKKIKALKKEEQLEKKAQSAEKNRKQRLETELKRELAIKKKNRKNRERNDVDESRRGLGANYDGILPEDANMQQIEEEIARLNIGSGAAGQMEASFDTGVGGSGGEGIPAELAAAGVTAGDAAATE